MKHFICFLMVFTSVLFCYSSLEAQNTRLLREYHQSHQSQDNTDVKASSPTVKDYDVKSYDKSGNLQGQAVLRGNTEKSYDKLGNLQDQAVVQGNVVKSYDRLGNLQSETVVKRNTTKSYDASGQYEGKTVVRGNTTEIYGASGQYEGKAVVKGDVVKNYDASGQYQGESIMKPGTNNKSGQYHRKNEVIGNQHTERFVDPYTPYESKSDIGSARVQSGSPVSGSSVSESPVRIYRNKDGSARITNY